MKQIISKEELEELNNIKGKLRGLMLKASLELILEKEGEEALKKVEDAMENIGYSIKYKNLKLTTFYPLRLGVAILFVTKKLFNYGDREFQEIGRLGIKIIPIARVFAKYFVSLDKLTKEAPKMWKNIITIGEFQIVNINKKEKYVIARVKNCNLHPLIHSALQGNLSTVLEMVVKKPITITQTKSINEGDDYYEFLMKW